MRVDVGGRVGTTAWLAYLVSDEVQSVLGSMTVLCQSGHHSMSEIVHCQSRHYSMSDIVQLVTTLL